LKSLRKPAGQIVALCDAYGGAIANVASSASAFPHRDQQTFCIQYFSSWTRAADTPQRLTNMSKAYAAMRPHVPGACYVNYCDLDLPDWAMSYWGANLSRLRQIKSQYDQQHFSPRPKRSADPERVESMKLKQEILQSPHYQNGIDCLKSFCIGTEHSALASMFPNLFVCAFNVIRTSRNVFRYS